MIQDMASKLVVMLVLLATCNTSIIGASSHDNSSSTIKNLKRAVYYFNGTGERLIKGAKIHGTDNLVLDVVIKPSSLKKQGVIVQQGNGKNGYRLLQDGRNLIFELDVKGITQRSIATKVLEKDEAVFISASFENGLMTWTIDGKQTVERKYQLHKEKFAHLGCEKHIINGLTALENESFHNRKDYKKAVRKVLGRRDFKKFGEQIIEMAYQEQAVASLFVGDNFLASNAQINVGHEFKGSIEQLRLWQPAKMLALKKEAATQSVSLTSLKLSASKSISKAEFGEVIDTDYQLANANVETGIKTSISKVVERNEIFVNEIRGSRDVSTCTQAQFAKDDLSLQSNGLSTTTQTAFDEKVESYSTCQYKISDQQENTAKRILDNIRLNKNDEVLSGLASTNLKKWNCRGFIYVNNRVLEISTSDISLTSNFSELRRDDELGNNIGEGHRSNFRKISHRNIFINPDVEDCHSRYYVGPKNESVFLGDRQIGKVPRLESQCLLLTCHSVSSVDFSLLDNKLQGQFNSFSNRATELILPERNGVKYVNQYLRISTFPFRTVNWNVDSGSITEANRYWHTSIVDEKLFGVGSNSNVNSNSYHIEVNLSSLLSEWCTTALYTENKISENDSFVIKLNKKIGVKQQISTNSGEVNFVANSISSCDSKTIAYLDRIKYHQYEGPPEIPDILCCNNLEIFIASEVQDALG